jgi:hypothetical protein
VVALKLAERTVILDAGTVVFGGSEKEILKISNCVPSIWQFKISQISILSGFTYFRSIFDFSSRAPFLSITIFLDYPYYSIPLHTTLSFLVFLV